MRQAESRPNPEPDRARRDSFRSRRIREAYRLSLREAGGVAAFRRYWLKLLEQAAGRRAVEYGRLERGVLAHGAPWAGLASAPIAELLRRFVDRGAGVGLDLSMASRAWAPMALVFPNVGALSTCCPFFWLPVRRLERREHLDGVPYRVWAAEGLIEIVPGRCYQYARHP